MPKIAPDISIEELLQKVEASGTALGEKATALSKIIEEVDLRLRDMPGKTALSVASDGVVLTFWRWPHWALRLIDSDSAKDDEDDPVPEELTGVSILRKARALPLLPRLLRDIEEQQKHHAMEIAKAFESLDVESASVRTDRKGDK